MANDRLLGLIVLQLAVVVLLAGDDSPAVVELLAPWLGTATLVIGLVFVLAPRENGESRPDGEPID